MNTTIAGRASTERIEVLGEFDLTTSARFLADFTPAARRDAGAEPGVLRLAFPVEGSWEHAGALIRQRAPGVVEVEVDAPPGRARTVAGQVRRILSLDVDGSDFAGLCDTDPVAARLLTEHHGLRPVLFHSPYEAACWAVICHRLRIGQAAAIKQRLAELYGQPVPVGGQMLASFPAPDVLRGLGPQPGLSVQKVRRLASVAEAALDGVLDATTLRAMPADDALERVRQLPGVGPFSAELIVVRGAGHPDIFPLHEPRLRDEMAHLYGVSDAGEVAALAERWQPYRSWMAFLLRVSRELRTGELTGEGGNDER